MIYRIDYKEYERKTIMELAYTPVRFKTVFISAPSIIAAEDLFYGVCMNTEVEIRRTRALDEQQKYGLVFGPVEDI